MPSPQGSPAAQVCTGAVAASGRWRNSACRAGEAPVTRRSCRATWRLWGWPEHVSPRLTRDVLPGCQWSEGGLSLLSRVRAPWVQEDVAYPSGLIRSEAVPSAFLRKDPPRPADARGQQSARMVRVGR
uniref:Uncharacterized protein n=1 Tax=Pipistrellus kuhlii TaxID=59472 RepID=A0A7J7VUL5_PIPKU|nr:hypothetical protein mPipKuh1_008249 [Pipistrellus kuhlii]